MKNLYLEVNVTAGTYKINGQQPPGGGLQIVHGDVVQFAVQFLEAIPESVGGTGALTAVDLTAGGSPNALRFTCDDARLEAATLLTQQTSYNQGTWSLEDLAAGRVSWVVDFGTAACTTEIGTSESASVYGEFSLLPANNYPQTLLQFPITLLAQIDDGASGSPPPSTPTYDTAATIASTYALDATTTAVSTTQTLTSADRQINYLTSGAITLTLPALSGIDDGYRPHFFKTDSGTTLTIDTTGADTINGAASVTLDTQYGGFYLIPDVTGTNWIIPTWATP